MEAPLSITDINLADEYGQTYSFHILQPGELAPIAAGLYAFVRVETIGIGMSPSSPRMHIGYVGMTDDGIRARLSGHERIDDAKAWGATHILVLAAPGWTADERAELERRLIRHYDPPLNRDNKGILGLRG